MPENEKPITFEPLYQYTIFGTRYDRTEFYQDCTDIAIFGDLAKWFNRHIRIDGPWEVLMVSKRLKSDRRNFEIIHEYRAPEQEVREYRLSPMEGPMKLTRVLIHNFRCFQHVDFEMPQANGLYLLTGKNEHNLRLGANGIGKSTLFDAICWALYGKTSRKKSAGKLLNRNGDSKSYYVQLEFDDGTTLRRNWPNKTMLNGQEVDDATVQNMFRLTFEQFLYAVYQCQRAAHFVDLTPDKKLTFLSELFDLEKWIRCSDVCKDRMKEYKTQESVLLEAVELFSKSIESNEGALARVIEDTLAWHEQNKKEIDTIQSQVNELQAEIAEAPSLDELKEIEDAMNAEREAGRRAVKEAMTATSKANEAVTRVKLEINTLTKQIERLLAKESSECPECKQTVQPDHVAAIAEPLAARLVEKEAELEEAQAAHKLALKADDEAEKQANEVVKAQTEQTKLIAELRATIAQHDKTRAQIKRLQEQIKEYTNKTCPLTRVEQATKQTLEADRVALKEAQDKLTKVQSEVSQYEFWAKHFPLIRLSIIKEVTQELELHFNQAFARMGLGDYTVNLDSERELKSEGTKKEIVLRIENNGKPLEYEECSGGEQQRIKLATAVGVSELIKSRLGIVWPLLMVDEPSQGLSEPGIADMLELFSELATTMVVMLAEHRVVDTFNFSGVYQITKQPNEHSVLNETRQSSAVREHVPTGT